MDRRWIAPNPAVSTRRRDIRVRNTDWSPVPFRVPWNVAVRAFSRKKRPVRLIYTESSETRLARARLSRWIQQQTF